MNKFFKTWVGRFTLLVIIVFGVFIFFYGGYDNSPGAQGLGFLLIAGGIIGFIKSRKGDIS